MTSKQSAALSNFVREFNLQSRGFVADKKSGVTVHQWFWRQAGTTVVTIDRGEDGWDVFVPVCSENSIAATKDAMTAFCRKQVEMRDKREAAAFEAAIG